MDRAIRQLSLLPVTGRIEVKTLVCAGARVESLELEAREARGMDRGRYIKRVSRGTRAVLRTYPCVSCRNHLARENEISVNPRPREPRFVRGPSVRFRPSRAPQMQVEPRPSLTPSLVVPKNTCVETRALECPPARRAGIHTRCRNPKKKKNRPLLGHTHDDKERSELLL